MKKYLQRIALLFFVISTPCIAEETQEEPIIIDYMVTYSPEVEEAAGGEEAMKQQALENIAHVNEVLGNSGLGHISFNLVHAQAWTEERLGDYLDLPNSNILSHRELREKYRADCYSTVTMDFSLNAWGAIPVREGGNSSYQCSTTFSYRNYGQKVLAHELGHNMGGNHNRPETAGNMTAYGFNFVGDDGVHYRTVMSYGYPGEGLATTTGIPHYSNPAVLYEGQPTGKLDSEDMAESIRYWAPRLSNKYRDTLPEPTPPLPPPLPPPVTPNIEGSKLLAPLFLLLGDSNDHQQLLE